MSSLVEKAIKLERRLNIGRTDTQHLLHCADARRGHEWPKRCRTGARGAPRRFEDDQSGTAIELREIECVGANGLYAGKPSLIIEAQPGTPMRQTNETMTKTRTAENARQPAMAEAVEDDERAYRLSGRSC